MSKEPLDALVCATALGFEKAARAGQGTGLALPIGSIDVVGRRGRQAVGIVFGQTRARTARYVALATGSILSGSTSARFVLTGHA